MLGFGGWLVVTAIGAGVAIAAKTIGDKLGKKSYSSSSLDDQIDVDKELSKFRENINGEARQVEKECMQEIDTCFLNLKQKTKERFPDLVQIVESKQANAKKELSGTIMQYVKEHLSKNDRDFVKVLEMPPGQAKKSALDVKTNQILNDAVSHFFGKLNKYMIAVQKDFTVRLTTRLVDQENQVKDYIIELEKLEKQARDGSIDVNEVVNKCTPVMESAESIIAILEMDEDEFLDKNRVS